MGRRSINSTKAGKFMNPTDQARKEARRKELKKNKKQRLQVRQAVIKQKDPKHIMNELEQLDRMEYDINNPPPYNVKVLQDKRRKLKETWAKMHQFYLKEDPKLAGELKAVEYDYERKRHHMVTLHESIMQAQKVKVDEIPLPDNIPMPGEISLPPELPIEPAPKSILKLKPKEIEKVKIDRDPPGPPPGSPPSLSEFEDDEDIGPKSVVSEPIKTTTQDKSKKIRFSETESVNPAYGSYLNPALVPRGPGGVVIPAPPPPPPPQLPPQSQPYIPRTVHQHPIRNHPYYPPPPPPPPPSQRTNVDASAASQAATYEAKPILRNKLAEITKFVPTSLVVKREIKKPITPSSTSLSLNQTPPNHGPYNYMLHQQQQYATLNPVRSSFSTGSGDARVAGNSAMASSLKAPSAKLIEPKDATYDNFMKEIGKLL